MRKWLSFVLCIVIAGNAHARKDCTELKGEIDAKITANGVPHYRLDIVETTEDTTTLGKAKVVGTCDGGTKQIVYERLAPASATELAKR